MAERSKAPDSSANLPVRVKAFWSSIEGVGSNPTSDKSFFFKFHFKDASGYILKDVFHLGLSLYFFFGRVDVGRLGLTTATRT